MNFISTDLAENWTTDDVCNGFRYFTVCSFGIVSFPKRATYLVCIPDGINFASDTGCPAVAELSIKTEPNLT